MSLFWYFRGLWVKIKVIGCRYSESTPFNRVFYETLLGRCSCLGSYTSHLLYIVLIWGKGFRIESRIALFCLILRRNLVLRHSHKKDWRLDRDQTIRRTNTLLFRCNLIRWNLQNDASYKKAYTIWRHCLVLST